MHGFDCVQSLAVLLHWLQSQRLLGRDDSDDSSSSSSYCVSGTISLRLLLELELAFHVGCNQYGLKTDSHSYSLPFEPQAVPPVGSDSDFAPDSDSDSEFSSPLHPPSHHPSPPPPLLPPKASFVFYPVPLGNDPLPSLLLFHPGRKVRYRRMMLCILGILDLCGACRWCSSIREYVRHLQSAFSRNLADVTYIHRSRISHPDLLALSPPAKNQLTVKTILEHRWHV